MHALQCQHDIDVHLIFCFDIDLLITCSEVVFNLDFLCRSSLMGTTLRAAPNKSYAFSTNCLTWIVFFDAHFVYSTHQELCHVNKLSCMYCNAHMM